jgi:hypothetical protein
MLILFYFSQNYSIFALDFATKPIKSVLGCGKIEVL